jgi:hypothetical protein
MDDDGPTLDTVREVPMATTTTPAKPTARPGRAATVAARPAARRGTADRIPPHWPDDLDVPVPSLAIGPA